DDNAPHLASTPPASQACNTRRGEPRSANRNPPVVTTPVPIILATTSAVALTRPSCRCPVTSIRGAARWAGPSRSRFLLSLLAGHRDEPDRQHPALLHRLSHFPQQIKPLVAGGT